MSVKVISLFEKETDTNGIYINTTSKAETNWQTDLSPFYLGPCQLYGDYTAVKMENGWQYSKVYPDYDNSGQPKNEYFDWANEGWMNPKAIRYPMGKGKKPLYSWWNGQKFSYVEARKKIYIPLYAKSVTKTKGYQILKDIYHDVRKTSNGTLYLKDYDAYRHEEKRMSLSDVVNNPNKKCGHAFVLMMLLTNDPVLTECQLPS